MDFRQEDEETVSSLPLLEIQCIAHKLNYFTLPVNIFNNPLVKTRLNLHRKDVCKVADKVRFSLEREKGYFVKKLAFKEFNPTCVMCQQKRSEPKIVKPRAEENPRLTVQELLDILIRFYLYQRGLNCTCENCRRTRN